MAGRLARQSGVYALAGLAGKVSGLVLTAFYVNTAYLSVEGFGVFGLLRAAMMTALLVAGAGLPLGLLRFASARELSAADRARVPSTALVLAAVAGGLAALAIGLAAPWLAGGLGLDGLGAGAGGPGAAAESVRWLAVYVGFKTVADVSYTWLRHREAVGRYVALSAAESLVLLLAVLAFLVGAREGLVGVMKGYALSAAVVAVFATVALVRAVPWRPSRALVGPLLAFGAPLMVSGLATHLLYFGDRFVIVRLAGFEANATYELAAQFGALVFTFVVQAVTMSFTVAGMKVQGEAARGLYRSAFRHVAAVAGGAALGIGLFASAAAGVVATDPAYLALDVPAFLVAAGFAFAGLHAVAVTALYAAGRTRAVAVAVGAAALLNLGLCAALVPVLGIAGAALATLAAYAALAVWTGRAAEPLVGAPMPWAAVVGVCVAAGALWALGQQVPADTAAGLALRAGVVAAYPAALGALGVYGRAEIAAALAAALAAVRARVGPRGAR